jgi:transcriptional regulator with XRE-family HTH domain
MTGSDPLMAREKQPNQVDVDVGRRIRIQRKNKGLSQSGLADALGITFQQVQKYEKGTNRVGASRISHIAQILEVPVAFFFDGNQPQAGEEGSIDHETKATELMKFVASPVGRDLNEAFMQIRSHSVKKRVVNLVKALALNSEDGP